MAHGDILESGIERDCTTRLWERRRRRRASSKDARKRKLSLTAMVHDD